MVDQAEIKRTMAELAALEDVEKQAHAAVIAKRAELRSAVQMPIRNGIRRPKPGTLGRTIWDTADLMSGVLERPVSSRELFEWIKSRGVRPTTVRYEHHRWTRFNAERIVF